MLACGAVTQVTVQAVRQRGMEVTELGGAPFEVRVRVRVVRKSSCLQLVARGVCLARVGVM
jgi:hypothetical protein